MTRTTNINPFQAEPEQYFQQQTHPLSDDELRSFAPSIFATRPWAAMSERYAFIPTIDVVRKMRSEGFLPYSAVQAKARNADKAPYTKHLIRFRPVGGKAAAGVDDLEPELILTNAHDGSSRYVLHGGGFRKVCLNGLMVPANEHYQTLNVTHKGDVGKVIDASFQLVEEFPKMLEEVGQFQRRLLAPPQAEAYATSALVLRYDDVDAAPVTVTQLLEPARQEDATGTLWATFNTVQEKVLGGGLGYTKNGRRNRTRKINGIDQSSALNRALWALTSRMNELLGGALA